VNGDRKILNIGCGFNKIDGAVNLDFDLRCRPDIVADLTKRMPFEDGCFDVVYASQVLEHIFNYEDLMLEIHRILKLDGVMYAGVPHWQGRNAVAGLGHVRYFVQESFLMFTDPRFYQPKCHPCDYQGLFEKIEMEIRAESVNGEESGSFLSSLEVMLRKVDQDHWKALDVTKGLEHNVKGCFWCQHELEWIEINKKKKCSNCGEVYTFDLQ